MGTKSHHLSSNGKVTLYGWLVCLDWIQPNKQICWQRLCLCYNATESKAGKLKDSRSVTSPYEVSVYSLNQVSQI